MTNDSASRAIASLREHGERRRIAAEIHARPFESLRGPMRASHLAMMGTDGWADLAHVKALCQRLGGDLPEETATHHSVALDGFRLRWERHQEFSTYTFFVSGAPDDVSAPLGQPALDAAPRDWLADLPGELMVATHLVLEARETPERSVHDIVEVFGTENVAGSEVADGAARAYTDFRLHADGYSHILIQDRGLPPRRAGRLVQRLLEIETYRILALLALPVARETTSTLGNLETGLKEVTQRITGGGNLESEQGLLQEISGLSAELERVTAWNSFRLSAARAYSSLVHRRIQHIREHRINELQTLEEYLARRFTPAMRTCESVAERQETLARRLSRAADLLRTRVDIALEAQNRDLLASMNRRTDLQLRLQQTVEGLSVLVMSYYGTGLVYYLASGIHGLGVPFSVDIAVGAAVPLVALSAFLGIRAMRRRVLGPEDH